MSDKALILDLDNTIFLTDTLERKTFMPFLIYFSGKLKPLYTDEVIEKIIRELWVKTWDVVMLEYNIPKAIFFDAVQVLDSMEFNFDIAPYPDYTAIKAMHHRKFLVTTSLTSLQLTKIKALGIENDFVEIVINDNFKNAKTKLDIFKELVATHNLIPEQTYVIGDNADSEIKAGRSLNMVTIQILRDGVTKGRADHHIFSFDELNAIIDAAE